MYLLLAVLTILTYASHNSRIDNSYCIIILRFCGTESYFFANVNYLLDCTGDSAVTLPPPWFATDSIVPANKMTRDFYRKWEYFSMVFFLGPNLQQSKTNGTSGTRRLLPSTTTDNGTNGVQRLQRSTTMVSGANGARNRPTTASGTNGTPFRPLLCQNKANGTNGTRFRPLPSGTNGTPHRPHHPRHTTLTRLPANST